MSAKPPSPVHANFFFFFFFWGNIGQSYKPRKSCVLMRPEKKSMGPTDVFVLLDTICYINSQR